MIPVLTAIRQLNASQLICPLQKLSITKIMYKTANTEQQQDFAQTATGNAL